MHCVGLGEPSVPVDSGTLVPPTVPLTSIDAEGDVVGGAVSKEVRYIEVEGNVAAVAAANITTVEKYDRVPEGAVELYPNAAAHVGRRNIEFAPIPAHAGFRIAAAERLISVRAQRIVSGTCIVMHKR